jgi:hypothetical protein
VLRALSTVDEECDELSATIPPLRMECSGRDDSSLRWCSRPFEARGKAIVEGPNVG